MLQIHVTRADYDYKKNADNDRKEKSTEVDVIKTFDLWCHRKLSRPNVKRHILIKTKSSL